MKDVNLHNPVKVGPKVLVIGGGNVALDCARSARRLGASEVHVACLECKEDMPAETEISSPVTTGNGRLATFKHWARRVTLASIFGGVVSSRLTRGRIGFGVGRSA